MNIQPDIESWLTLSFIEGLGDESFRKLLLTFKHPTDILNAEAQLLERYVKKHSEEKKSVKGQPVNVV